MTCRVLVAREHEGFEEKLKAKRDICMQHWRQLKTICVDVDDSNNV